MTSRSKGAVNHQNDCTNRSEVCPSSFSARHAALGNVVAGVVSALVRIPTPPPLCRMVDAHLNFLRVHVCCTSLAFLRPHKWAWQEPLSSTVVFPASPSATALPTWPHRSRASVGRGRAWLAPVGGRWPSAAVRFLSPTTTPSTKSCVSILLPVDRRYALSLAVCTTPAQLSQHGVRQLQARWYAHRITILRCLTAFCC